jgi:hypothetical protein
VVGIDCVGSAAETGACVVAGVPLEGPVTAMVTMPPVTNAIRETTTIKPIPSPPCGLSFFPTSTRRYLF